MYALCKEISQRMIFKTLCTKVFHAIFPSKYFCRTHFLYVIFQVDDSGSCDFKSSNEEIFPEILTG